MTLIGALLCRNEAAPDRYLKLVLDNMLRYCDSVVAWDDSSEDDTRAVLESAGVEIASPRGAQRAGEGFWGHDEVAPRAGLWEAATKVAGPDGWIYVADADHELVGITPSELRACCTTRIVTAWVMPLWDCWVPDGTAMRVDNMWQAHNHPRPWLFKVPPANFVPYWGERKEIHVGHYPHNLPLTCGVLPGAAIRHWGYSKQHHREEKCRRYLRLNSPT